MKRILVLIFALFAAASGAQTNTYNILDTITLSGTADVNSGTIDNTVIGGSIPAAGTFTNLTANTLFQVGSGSTTNAGWIAGYCGSSGFSCLWNTSVVPSVANYTLATNGGNTTSLNSGTTLNLLIANTARLAVNAASVISAVPLSTTDVTDASSTTTGSLKTAGGLGVVKKAYFGDSLNVAAPGTISVGTGSGTSAGLIAGYSGSSGFGSIWSTAVTPSGTNHMLQAGATTTGINAVTTLYLTIGNTPKVTVNATGITHVGDMIYGKTITAPGTTGAQTIDKTTGRVNFAAAATSLVVTNSLATANSICHVTKATNDSTMRLGACVAAAGTITIYADVAPAAEAAVNFTITN